MDILWDALRVLLVFGIMFISAVVVVTVHEYAHAFISWRLGDKLPKFNRRLTLSPISHTDIVGILFFMVTSFGWGRPVETSSKYYKDKKKGIVLVGLSGSIASIMLAVIAIIVLKVLSISSSLSIPPAIWDNLSILLSSIYIYSFNMAIISLIPMYPFDGLAVWGKFISSKGQYKLMQYQSLMLTIFVLIMLVAGQLLDTLIVPFRGVVSWSVSGVTEMIAGWIR